MMQHVATAKSEVAAFATGAQTNSFSDPKSNEQFGKLMQDQKASHSVAGVSEAPPPHSRRKQALQQSVDEVKNVPSKVETEDTKIKVGSRSSEQAETPTATPTTSQEKPAKQPSNIKNDQHFCVEGHDENTSEASTVDLNVELEIGDTDAELLLSLEDKAIGTNGEAQSVDAQQWITLVDSLQKLTDTAPSKEQDIIGHEEQLKEASEADLNPKNTVSAEDIEVEQSISILVDQALKDVLLNPELPELDIREEVVDVLLDKTDVLQDLVSKFPLAKQESDTAELNQITGSNKSDSIIDNVSETASSLSNQDVETDGEIDFTVTENKVLLKSLLMDSEVGKEIEQGLAKLAKLSSADKPEQLVKEQQTESLTKKLESTSEQEELLEQDVQVEPKSLLSSSKTDKVTDNSDIKNILNLSDKQQDKILENIAQQMFDSNKPAEPVSPEQVVQQIVIPKAAEIMSSVDSPSKEFISVLKSGLAEYKEQLSQGREPGIDLKALVSDALEKTTETGGVIKTPANLEQAVNRVSQMLDFAQTVNRAIDHHHDQAYNATVKDVAQIQGEQSKQIQLNQFEKAVSIAKPEGHQQLAEKVRWMVNTKNLVAEIRLDPAELGSMHVKVAVSGESATVSFVVQSQQARDAVDTATPRLKEMLAEKGIELGESSVRQESGSQEQQASSDLAGQGDGSTAEMDEEMPEQLLASQKIVNGALGGIDYFV